MLKPMSRVQKRSWGNRKHVARSISDHSNHNLVQISNAFSHVSLVREGGPMSSNQIPWYGVTYVLWALTSHVKGRWGLIGKRWLLMWNEASIVWLFCHKIIISGTYFGTDMLHPMSREIFGHNWSISQCCQVQLVTSWQLRRKKHFQVGCAMCISNIDVCASQNNNK